MRTSVLILLGLLCVLAASSTFRGKVTKHIGEVERPHARVAIDLDDSASDIDIEDVRIGKGKNHISVDGKHASVGVKVGKISGGVGADYGKSKKGGHISAAGWGAHGHKHADGSWTAGAKAGVGVANVHGTVGQHKDGRKHGSLGVEASLSAAGVKGKVGATVRAGENTHGGVDYGADAHANGDAKIGGVDAHASGNVKGTLHDNGKVSYGASGNANVKGSVAGVKANAGVSGGVHVSQEGGVSAKGHAHASANGNVGKANGNIGVSANGHVNSEGASYNANVNGQGNIPGEKGSFKASIDQDGKGHAHAGASGAVSKSKSWSFGFGSSSSDEKEDGEDGALVYDLDFFYVSNEDNN